MSIFKSLHDVPDWAVAMLFCVFATLSILVFVLLAMYGPERHEDSDFRRESGGELTGQDAGTNRENREEDIFFCFILSKSDQDDNQICLPKN